MQLTVSMSAAGSELNKLLVKKFGGYSAKHILRKPGRKGDALSANILLHGKVLGVYTRKATDTEGSFNFDTADLERDSRLLLKMDPDEFVQELIDLYERM